MSLLIYVEGYMGCSSTASYPWLNILFVPLTNPDERLRGKNIAWGPWAARVYECILQILPVGDFNVELRQELGRGRFGTVFRATDKEGKYVAAKKIDYTDPKMELENAVKQQEKCTHENLVRIFGVTSLKDETWIFMELIEGSDMQRHFRRNPDLLNGFDTKAALMTQIAKGLNYLHDVNVVHRDIKPENILVSLSKDTHVITLKLADFGIARFLEEDESTMTTNVGTFPYKAPEFWEVKSDGSLAYHRSIDVFSLGLTFLAMYQSKQGKPLVPMVENLEEKFNHHVPIAYIMFNRREYGQPELIVIQDKEHDNDNVKVLKDLIRKMTKLAPEERCSMMDVLDQMNLVLK